MTHLKEDRAMAPGSPSRGAGSLAAPVGPARPIPPAASLVALVARNWPWWKGQSRLTRCFDLALGGKRGHAIARLNNSELRLKVPLGDSVGRKLIAFAENDRELFQFLCLELEDAGRDAIYLDVGVNLGVFLLRMAERFPIVCIGFEPQAHLCALLRDNIANNSLKGTVNFRNAAVGSEVGTVRFDVNEEDSGIARVSDEETGVPVRLTTLAQEFDLEAWKRVKVVKIDVEGFELEVFKGASELFKHHRPTLVFEVNTDEMTNRGLVPGALGDVLRESGYTEFWALEKHLYPIENGMFKVANVVAVGAGGSAAVSRLGIERNYFPKRQKNWPVKQYEF